MMSADVMHGQSQASMHGFQHRSASGSMQQHHHQSQPCGAAFGFDGKLVQYFNVRREMGVGELPAQRLVTISKVVTQPEFVSRAEKLDSALESGNIADFCQQKAQEVPDASESKVWQFLQASFSPTPTQAYLSMLGYDSEEMFSKLQNVVALHRDKEGSDTITDGFVSLDRGVPDGFVGNEARQNGDIECDTHAASHGHETDKHSFDIPTDQSVDGLINQALLSGNTEIAVDLCLQNSRWEDALILATTGSQELIKKTQQQYFQKRGHKTSNMIVAVVTRDLRRVVEHCDLNCWKEALATALTYSDSLGFPYLAETLGRRLGSSESESLKKSALLCYICCGHINHLVQSWTSLAIESANESDKPEHLQDVVEQLMVLKKAGEIHGKEFSHLESILSEKLVKYGSLLVSQGSLKIALKYISDSTDPSIVDLKQRVEIVLGMSRPAPVTSMRQTRSRQASESSRYPLNKRPSYPLPGQSQLSPGLATTSYDNHMGPRRSSAYIDGPNLNSLTGPPVAPQPVDAMSGYYNPLNVNTAMGYTPAYGQPQQQTPVASGLMSGGSSYYNAYNPTPERRPSLATLPPPPVSNVPHGWNDPPPLKPKQKPVQSTQPQVEAITHPIFGSAAPEPQTNYFTPHGAGDQHGSSSLLGYAHGLPPSGLSKPVGPPPPSMHSANPYAPSAVPQYGAPPMQSSFNPPPVQQYGMPPAPSSFMASPPQMQGPPPSFPPTGSSQHQNPPSAFMTPPPSMHKPPSNVGHLPPSGPPHPQSSQFMPSPPHMQPPVSNFNQPPSGTSHYQPPPCQFMPSPPHTQTPASNFNQPPASNFNQPPTSHYQQPPSQFMPTTPPMHGNASNFNHPPSGPSYQQNPPSQFMPTTPPQGPTANYGLPPTGSSHFQPPPMSGYNQGPPNEVPNYGAPPPMRNSVPPSSNPAPHGAPPTINSHEETSKNQFSSSSYNSAFVTEDYSSSGGPNYGKSTPPSNFGQQQQNSATFSPPPAKNDDSETSQSENQFSSFSNTTTSAAEATFSAGIPSYGSPSPVSNFGMPQQIPAEIETPLKVHNEFGRTHLEDQFSSVSLNSPAIVDDARSTPKELQGNPPTAPPITSFDPPFAPPSDGNLNASPYHRPPSSNANPFLNQSYPRSESSTPTPIYALPKSEPPQVKPQESKPLPQKSDAKIVPAEHEALPRILEALRSACYNNTQAIAQKRKLEDIGRKLEILSDKLQEGCLSAKTLDSLHKMVEALGNKDYNLALSLHTLLVTSGNFSEISSFFPAIKALIQTAAQLGVYI